MKIFLNTSDINNPTIEITKTKDMKSNFTMLEATNKDEAVKSILNVIEENPLWLNKVNGSLLAILKVLSEEEREFLLEKQLDEHVIDLFVNMKQEYYHFKNVTQWNY
tara:strand:- start:293 stop:613 length:321 start_codon:yes stop_codon:yes gene_type:complete